VHRGIEVDLHLTPGLPNESFVAVALGNLIAYRLQHQRGETLQWQILQVEGGSDHHFRLVLRHPDRVLDIGLQHDLHRDLEELRQRTPAELHQELDAAKKDGLVPVGLRHLTELPDFWKDDFWNWFG
jgi:hypothetical protein